MIMKIFDGLRNVIAGLGTDRDKGGQEEYYEVPFDANALAIAYKVSSLIRRVVDLPAEDSCREWREWQADSNEISLLEKEEKRLGVRDKVLQARKHARLFGGAAILIGTGDKDPTLPLDLTRIRKGGIKYLTVLSRFDIQAGDIERDPTTEGFNKPKFWTMTNMTGGMYRIHPSRLVIFHGIPPVIGIGFSAHQGWGDSILPGMIDAVKRIDAVAGNILSLVYEAKIDVIKIPELMQNLQSRGATYERLVMDRLRLAGQAKGINGMFVMDSEEDYQQKSASFGGLHEILDRFMQLTSAVSGIPMILLFGTSPGGLNATGDNDIRSYYDRVKVEQTLSMTPDMYFLDEAIVMSSLGSRPEELHYLWRNLWQPTAKEKAEVGKLLVDTLKGLYDMGLFSQEALSSAAVNSLTESGSFPGLEGYVNEFPVEQDDFEETETEKEDPSAEPEVESEVDSEEKDQEAK